MARQCAQFSRTSRLSNSPHAITLRKLSHREDYSVQVHNVTDAQLLVGASVTTLQILTHFHIIQLLFPNTRDAITSRVYMYSVLGQYPPITLTSSVSPAHPSLVTTSKIQSFPAYTRIHTDVRIQEVSLCPHAPENQVFTLYPPHPLIYLPFI